MTPPGAPVPDQVPDHVSVASDRFATRIERLDPTKRDGDGLHTVSVAVLRLLEKYHPETEWSELVEMALMIEATAAKTDELQKAVSQPRFLPTDYGDLVVLDFLALTPMLSRDPANPRSITSLGSTGRGSHKFDYTAPVLAEHDLRGLRSLRFLDVGHYQRLHDAHRDALGFSGSVRDHRDRLDLERGVRVGILKPGIAALTRVVDDDTGATGMQVVLVDANRRLTFAEVIHNAVMPTLQFGTFSRRHFFDGSGLRFRSFTAADAQSARDALADAYADFDGPAPTGDLAHDERALDRWADEIMRNHPDWAGVLRTRVMPCRLIVGVDRHSGLDRDNPMTVAIGAYRDQLHLTELSDVPWKLNATEAMVGQDLLRKSRDVQTVPSMPDWQDAILFSPTSIDWHVPGIRSTHDREVAAEALGIEVAAVLESMPDVAALLEDLPPALPGDAHERGLNALDLILSSTYTLVCRSQPMARTVGEVLAHHRMPNSPKSRGQVATSSVLPVLRLPADGADTARATAALSRTISHAQVYKLDETFDPLGENMTWPDLIGTDWFDVLRRARDELATGRGTTAHGERRYGPAQILLALAAAICMEVSPAVITAADGPSKHQLTLSGLGGQRGSSRAEPLAVLLPLVITEEGIDQLWEIVVAAIAEERPRLPRSVRWDPAKAADDTHHNHWTPFVTEYDLRGAPWGHESVGVGGRSNIGPSAGGTVYNGASAYVDVLFSDAASQLEAVAAQVDSVVNAENREQVDPSLDPHADPYGGMPTLAYLSEGVDAEVADRIVDATTRLSRAATEGKVRRDSSNRGSTR